VTPITVRKGMGGQFQSVDYILMDICQVVDNARVKRLARARIRKNDT